MHTSRQWELYKQRSKEKTEARNRMMEEQKLELDDTRVQLEEARKEIKNLKSSNLGIGTAGTSQRPIRAFGEPPAILQSLRVQQLELNELKVQLEEAITQIKKLKDTNLVIMAESVKKKTDADEEIDNLRWENEQLRELCKTLEHSSVASETELVEKETQTQEKFVLDEKQIIQLKNLHKIIKDSKLEIESTLRKRTEVKDAYDSQLENIERLKQDNNLRLARCIEGKIGTELDNQLKLHENQNNTLKLLQSQVENQALSDINDVMTDFLLSKQRELNELELVDDGYKSSSCGIDIEQSFETSQSAKTTSDVVKHKTLLNNQSIWHKKIEIYPETMQTYLRWIDTKLLKQKMRRDAGEQEIQERQ